jgi:inorganic pyrophosphatase
MHLSPELTNLGAHDPDSGLVQVIIDTPQGSRNKYKYDEKLSLYRLSKVLPLGSAFPYDFGYIPGTRAEDGDALDVLVVGEEPLFPGCLVTVRLVGVLQAEQTEHGRTFRNDRHVGVIETAVNRPEIQALEELGEQHLAEIEHFFMAYNQVEGRQFKPLGRHGPEAAERLVTDGIRRCEAGRNGAT